MFFSNSKNSNRLKKATYICASTILGVLLSFLVHAIIEMGYLSWAEKNNFAVTFYRGCALPIVLQILLIVGGVVGGFHLGRYWWRMVYVESRWGGVFRKYFVK